jgi:hypothetical protein
MLRHAHVLFVDFITTKVRKLLHGKGIRISAEKKIFHYL